MTEYQRQQNKAKYEMIQKALAKCDQCVTRAAAYLEIDRKTIYNILNRQKEVEAQ